MSLRPDREIYRKIYQMELVSKLVGKNAAAIRKAMYRSGLGRTTGGFVEYIKKVLEVGK